MLWFFKKHQLHLYKMLDVMAITTCLVHMFGRVGCFMAGCCYGKPTDSAFAVVFSDPVCYANPKGVGLHPTQLYEAGFILLMMVGLLILRAKRRFYGQLFLIYLMAYAFGRFGLEYMRGDTGRGFVVDGYISHSQFIALVIVIVVSFVYILWSKRNQLVVTKR